MSKDAFTYNSGSTVSLDQAKASRRVVWATYTLPVLVVAGLYTGGVVAFGWGAMLIGTAVVVGISLFFTTIIMWDELESFFSVHFRRYRMAKQIGVCDD